MSNRFDVSIEEEINAGLADSISEITNHEIPGAEKKRKKIAIFYSLSVKSVMVLLSLLLLFYFVIKYYKKLCFDL